MRLWEWLAVRFQRPVAAPPVTPPEEHAKAERRLTNIEQRLTRLERLRDVMRRDPSP